MRVTSRRDGLENVSLDLEDLVDRKPILAEEVESYSDQAAQNY